MAWYTRRCTLSDTFCGHRVFSIGQNHLHNLLLRAPLLATDSVRVDVHGDVAVGVAHEVLWLAKIKSACEINNIQKRLVTCHMDKSLVRSFGEGHAFRAAETVPFLHDFDSNIRFLVALPVLIAADVFVSPHYFPGSPDLVTRCIVIDDELPAFRSAIDSALRLRNSVAMEVALVIFVYTAGHRMWLNQAALGEATWYANPLGTHLHLTAAGYWYVFFSIPFFQFILARWYLRLFIWYRLLGSISRLHWRLYAAHPDRAGGINFLAPPLMRFSPSCPGRCPRRRIRESSCSCRYNIKTLLSSRAHLVRTPYASVI